MIQAGTIIPEFNNPPPHQSPTTSEIDDII